MILCAIVAVLTLSILKSLMCAWVRPDIILKSADWGHVYVLQDVGSPRLIKIGLTRRMIGIRAAEVSRDMAGGRELRALYRVHMPYVAAVEIEAHRLLGRRNERSERGREWFRVRDASAGARAVLRAARTVRRIARLRRCWSIEAEQDACHGAESTRPMFLLCSNHARRTATRP